MIFFQSETPKAKRSKGVKRMSSLFVCGRLFLNKIRFLYPRSPEGKGGILFYLCPSFRPSKIFFVTFFSATINGRNLIFGPNLHIGMPYCGQRFWTRQIPTSCLPTQLVCIYIEHICIFFVAFFSATIDDTNLIFGHKLHIVGSVFGPIRFLLPVSQTLLIFIYIEHICSFFVAFFSATIDGRNLIFGHKLHIGTPYRGKRFLTRQIPTSWLPKSGGIIREHQLTVHLVFSRCCL